MFRCVRELEFEKKTDKIDKTDKTDKTGKIEKRTGPLSVSVCAVLRYCGMQ